jgi:hypothetical protein
MVYSLRSMLLCTGERYSTNPAGVSPIGRPSMFLLLSRLFLSHQRVTVWCDSRVAVSVLHLGRGSDPILHTIVRNIRLLSSLDCDVPGRLNVVADLLSRWDSRRCPTADLFSLLGMVLCWLPVPDEVLQLDATI